MSKASRTRILKWIGLIAAAIMLLSAGVVIGWRVALSAYQRNVAFFTGGLAASETHIQEMDTMRVYFEGSPETALWALERLLLTY